MKNSFVQTFNCSGCPCSAKSNNSYANAYGGDGLSFEGTPSKTYGPDGLLNASGTPCAVPVIGKRNPATGKPYTQYDYQLALNKCAKGVKAGYGKGFDGSNFYGQHHNAGGYGFWCNKKCAARRDVKRAEKQAAAASEAQQSSALIQAVQELGSSIPGQGGGSSTFLYIGIGAGILLLGGIAYFMLRKK